MRSFILAIALTTCSLAAAPAALAQEQVCSEALTHPSWSQAMDDVDRAFAAFDPDKAGQLLTRIREHLPCLDTVVLPSHLGRFARQMAMAAFFEQDEINAVKWGMLQKHTAPELPWPKDIGEDHPLRQMLANAETPPMSGPDDKGIEVPKKGGVFLNGHLLEQPKTLAEVPGLLQIADKKGELIEAYWQDGAAFQEDLLGPADAVVTAPKWFEPEDPSTYGAAGTVFGSDEEGGAVADGETGEEGASGSEAIASGPAPAPRPSGGAKPLPRILAGGGLGILAGSLYALGAVSRGGLDQATNEDELVAARSRVNLMVIGAGAAAAAGVGVGVTAFVSTDGGGLRWGGRF